MTTARERELTDEIRQLRRANRRLQTEGPALERDKLIIALRTQANAPSDADLAEAGLKLQFLDGEWVATTENFTRLSGVGSTRAEALMQLVVAIRGAALWYGEEYRHMLLTRRIYCIGSPWSKDTPYLFNIRSA